VSRSLDEKLDAWRAWADLGDGTVAHAFRHQCGALTGLDLPIDDTPACSGCRFEVAHPERECEPLVRAVRYQPEPDAERTEMQAERAGPGG
jgi:hypothetical protein